MMTRKVKYNRQKASYKTCLGHHTLLNSNSMLINDNVRNEKAATASVVLHSIYVAKFFDFSLKM